jgi:16S rRNA (uracil1498-N3)-methyltransferase
VPRFFLSRDAIDGGRVRFDAAEAHHLARVLRLRPGAILEAIGGDGRVLSVRLEALEPGAAWGTVVGEARAAGESPCAITLAQAMLKGERMTWLIQKATELGVARIVPMETARVVARPAGDRADARRTRWERVAREAVKQCGRAVAPPIGAPRGFEELLAEAAAHDASWLCWEGGGAPLAEVAGAAGRPRRVLLLVGPEGGFTPDEVARAERTGVRIVGLGPRTLRAESAGIVAVALCQHHFGDLGCLVEAAP